MTAAIGARVGLVLVSHSTKIAEGLVELVRQMAPTAALLAAGGTDEGGIGTSFEKVQSAIETADGGDVDGGGVVVLCDLGSAILTAETALEFLDDELHERVVVVDAPLVEGAVAAGVAAEGGGSLDEVVRAAESARGEPAAAADGAAEPPTDAGGEVTRTVTLINVNGLHARPAAEFVRLAGTLDARVMVNGAKDATSLLGVMSLGLVKGDAVTLSATGAGAEDAIARLGDLVESGFGEA